MKNNVFLGLVAGLLLASCAFSANRPNILLITADDLGLQLSCYGDNTIQTPHLDRLAARSVRFQTAYVAQASCSPSRSAMFTGLYPHGNGHYGLANSNTAFHLHPHLIDQLLPNVLKRAGYRTGLIGKLHVAPEKKFAFDRRVGEGFGSRKVSQQVKAARDFIREDNEYPWFLMFNVFDPHAGHKSLPNGKRGPTYFPNQVDGIPEKIVTPGDISPWPWQQIDTPIQREKIAGYYNCVQRIDAAMGMLMKELDAADHGDDTLIIFLGDHGPPFARGKTSCYEAGLRVPFLVRWPDVSDAHVSDHLVSSVDIYPTILDAAGLPIPETVHGESLRPILNKQIAHPSWRSTLVGEFHYHGASPFFPRRAITDGRYKLIHNLRAGELSASPTVDGDTAHKDAQKLPKKNPARIAMERLENPPEWELYDLQNDLIEFHNRGEDPAFSTILKRLTKSLVSWQETTDDPFQKPAFIRSTDETFRMK